MRELRLTPNTPLLFKLSTRLLYSLCELPALCVLLQVRSFLSAFPEGRLFIATESTAYAKTITGEQQ